MARVLNSGLLRRRRRQGKVQTIVLDTFTRADSAVSMGNTEIGNLAWTPQAAAVGGISTNRGYFPTPGATNNTETIVDSGKADCTVTVTMTVLDTNQSGRVICRFTDTANKLRVDNDTTGLTLWKVVAGVFTSLGTAGAGASGDVISVVLSGNSIIVKRNGVTVVTASDAFNATATKHGFGTTDVAPAARFDNFSVTVP